MASLTPAGVLMGRARRPERIRGRISPVRAGYGRVVTAIRWAIFDLNGTLLDPGGLEPALDDAIVASMALTLSGGYAPFSGLLEAAVRRRAELAGDGEDAVEEAMAYAQAMAPYPEAAAALDTLAGAGVRLAVLTNSATDSAESSLASAGLRDRFAVVLGTDAARAFKPDQRVYRAGLEATGAEPEEACMVATHWWDLLGASAASLRTAWVARKERRLVRTAPQVTAQGQDLMDVAQAIAALA